MPTRRSRPLLGFSLPGKAFIRQPLFTRPFLINVCFCLQSEGLLFLMNDNDILCCSYDASSVALGLVRCFCCPIRWCSFRWLERERRTNRALSHSPMSLPPDSPAPCCCSTSHRAAAVEPVDTWRVVKTWYRYKYRHCNLWLGHRAHLSALSSQTIIKTSFAGLMNFVGRPMMCVVLLMVDLLLLMCTLLFMTGAKPGRLRRRPNFCCSRPHPFEIRFFVVVSLWRRLAAVTRRASYFFLAAFSAALVTLPWVTSLVFTDLITPTATVCRISRTAKRPKGGNSVKVSTHIGFWGTRSTMAASPDLTNLGLSSSFLPERRSIFSLISLKRQAIWAVWQSRTGE